MKKLTVLLIICVSLCSCASSTTHVYGLDNPRPREEMSSEAKCMNELYPFLLGLESLSESSYRVAMDLYKKSEMSACEFAGNVQNIITTENEQK